MRLIIKLGKFGFFAFLAYCMLIVYLLIYNITSGSFSTISSKSVNWFKSDISIVSGDYALAFMIHNTVRSNIYFLFIQFNLIFLINYEQIFFVLIDDNLRIKEI